jgi:hypothetical protein
LTALPALLLSSRAIASCRSRGCNEHLPTESSSHLIAVHPDNAGKKDWIILLEAGTSWALA